MLRIWFHTVFGFRPYHALRTASIGRTVWFAVYVMLLGIIFFNLYFSWQLRRQMPGFIAHFPTLTFDKGQLTTPGRQTVQVPKTDYQLIFDNQSALPSQQDFLDQKIMAFVQKDHFYMPSVTGVNQQIIPAQLNGTVDSVFLTQYAPSIRTFLQTVVLLGSVLAIGSFLLLSILMAAGVVFFWRNITRTPLSGAEILRLAVFLQGPALILWMIQVIWGVPLFVFALFILFNIYVQQIFNTWPLSGGKYAA